jgi:hypothetical protein
VSPVYQAVRNVAAAFALAADLPLRFSADELTGTGILATNSPFSRRVDCQTLRVPSQGAAVTPREFPLATQSDRGLIVMADGRYGYNWTTPTEWAGTCRELVVTRDDGVQHRAFFRFS